MVDTCTCCNGCSSRQLSSYSFSKKLLVAISIVVIIAMCLTPTEARSVKHRLRHRGADSPITKDLTMRNPLDKPLSQIKLTIIPQGKKIKHPKGSRNPRLLVILKQVVTRLKHARTSAKQEMDKMGLDDLKEYNNTTPKWLPTVNFVDIHFHNYKSNRSLEHGSTLATEDSKLLYMLPRLYKSLVQYEAIFKRLLRADLNFPDNPYTTYKRNRSLAIQKTLHEINHAINEIVDHITVANIPMPIINRNRWHFFTLEKEVDWTQCRTNDYLAFKSFNKFINNWMLEFRCPIGRVAKNQRCNSYNDRLLRKRNKRSQQVN